MIPLKDNIPTERLPLITYLLIAINVAVYLITTLRTGGSIWSGPPQDLVVHYGAIPYEFTHWGRHCDLTALSAASASATGVVCEGMRGVAGNAPPQPPTWETAFTAMFMHGSLLHIAGNMLFLWIFGNNVEDSMGRVRFAAFYVLGGLAALAGQIIVGTDSTAPTVGASGAIAAVLGAYLLLFPRARVLTLVIIIFFFTIVELPALAVLGFWFVLQVLYGYGNLVNPTGGGGGVAYFAHVGGFVFGMLLVHAFVKHRKSVPPPYPVY